MNTATANLAGWDAPLFSGPSPAVTASIHARHSADAGTTAFGELARNAGASGGAASVRPDFSIFYDGFTPEGSRIQFRVVAPAARSVKLAADFTNWERDAIAMRPEGDGVWQVSVPLAPGRYAYRYLVDGDRLEAEKRPEWGPSPFGTNHAVVVVI